MRAGKKTYNAQDLIAMTAISGDDEGADVRTQVPKPQ